MSLWSNPPTSTKTSFKKGDTHLGVYSLQSLLNDVYPELPPLVKDGVFGVNSDVRMRQYQTDVGLTADGIAGQATQSRMVRSCVVRSPRGRELPKGLLEGLVALESGGFIAAVNDSVSGGIDYGYTQRRCYGPPFDEAKVRQAANPLFQVSLSAEELYDRRQTYSVGRNPGCPFNAWELAVLHHNWPWAAATYYRYGKLPDPNKIATWVTWQRMTWDEWAHFYVDRVTKDVQW